MEVLTPLLVGLPSSEGQLGFLQTEAAHDGFQRLAGAHPSADGRLTDGHHSVNEQELVTNVMVMIDRFLSMIR